jgi:hypothetical protein
MFAGLFLEICPNRQPEWSMKKCWVRQFFDSERTYEAERRPRGKRSEIIREFLQHFGPENNA